MNKRLNIYEGGHPFDGDNLLFMQSQTETVEKMAKLFGENYIIHGIELVAGAFTAGHIVVSGEILPFAAGGTEERAVIVETSESVAYLIDADNDGQGDPLAVETTRFVRVFDAATDDEADAFDFSEFKRGADIFAYNLFDAFFRSIPLPYVGDPAQVHPWFKLCDGDNETPDLSGKFIVGYSPDDPDYDTIGKQGGAKTVTLTEAQMPQHNHSGNAVIPPHSHSLQGKTAITYDGEGGDGNRLTNKDNIGSGTVTQTSQSPQQNASITTNNKGGGAAHENRPPYYTAAFIIFKG